MAAPKFARDAKRFSLLFHYGVASEREIFEWADAQIIAMDSPPKEILDLATVHAGDTAAIIGMLNILSDGVDLWSEFDGVLGRLYDHLIQHPHDASKIANQVFHTLVVFTDVPGKYSFLDRFDDAFDLARAGIFGDEETVRWEFIEALRKFAAADEG